MNAITFINDLRKAVEHAEKAGNEVVSIEQLKHYLDEIQNIAASMENDSEAEQRRIERELQQNQKKFENDMELIKLRSVESMAMFNSVLEAGMNALKSSIIINGGAAVALLAFIGGLIKESITDSVISTNSVGYALFVFVVGVGAAGTATGGRYLAQFFYAEAVYRQHRGESQKLPMYVGNFLNVMTILMGLFSYCAFFYGGWQSYIALINQ